MIMYGWMIGHLFLEQLPEGFQSAALLLHPFVQMPIEWAQHHPQKGHGHIYPSNRDILDVGRSVSWNKIVLESHLKNYKELELALETSIGALNHNFARNDLAERLNAALRTGIYYPAEDCISVFLLDRMLKVLGSKGAGEIYFSEPIFDDKRRLRIADTTPMEICNLSTAECMIVDEYTEFGFLSIYDSFYTVFFAKENDISEVIQVMNCEAIICNKEMTLNWYME